MPRPATSAILLGHGAIMGLLKEKTTYRPTRLETALAWIVTVAAGVAVAWLVLRPWLVGS